MTAAPIAYDDFAKLELRVARVLEARSHPNADKLLLKVDIGGEMSGDRVDENRKPTIVTDG